MISCRKFLLYLLLVLSINAFAQPDKGLKTINGKEVMLHKVLTKETWTGIARTYNLSINDVKSVNPGIVDLKEGQIINVPLLPSLQSTNNNTTKKQAAESASPSPAINDTQNNTTQATTPKNTSGKHTVKEKETLFGIAKKYGVKVDDIKKWNNNIATVKIGQVINIKNPAVVKPLETTTAETGKKEPAAIPAEKKIETKSEIKEKPVLAKAEIIKNEKPAVKKENPSEIPTEIAATKPAKTEPALKTEKTIVLDNEQKSSTKKNEVKNNSGSVVSEYKETGMAAWIKDGSLNQNKYYALHRSAPLGTIVKVNNRMNGEYVFVKVVGQLPDSGDNQKQIIKISEAAAKKIGAVNEHFQVELNYGVLN